MTEFRIGDPVRVRKGYPFAGFIGQVNSEKDMSGFSVILQSPINSPPYEAYFNERELELIVLEEEAGR